MHGLYQTQNECEDWQSNIRERKSVRKPYRNSESHSFSERKSKNR